MIYNSLALPHINYGLLLWGQNQGRIFKLQKWAMRAITCSKYNAHTEPIFAKLKLLKIEDIHKIALLKLFHKYTNKSLPRYFDNFIQQKYLTHDHDTRHKNDPLPLDSNKESTKKCLRFYLPTHITKLTQTENLTRSQKTTEHRGSQPEYMLHLRIF